jgi:hypothetical protein
MQLSLLQTTISNDPFSSRLVTSGIGLGFSSQLTIDVLGDGYLQDPNIGCISLVCKGKRIEKWRDEVFVGL